MAKTIETKSVTVETKRHIVSLRFNLPTEAGHTMSADVTTAKITKDADGNVLSTVHQEMHIEENELKANREFANIYANLHDFFHGIRDTKDAAGIR